MSTGHFPQLERGQALAIVGPQGSGKSQLARQIAMGYGKFQQIETGPTFDFSLRDALNGKVNVLIVDGFLSRKERVEIKKLITNPTCTFRNPFSASLTTVPTPLVFLCMQDSSQIQQDDRRFHVIDLSSGVTA